MAPSPTDSYGINHIAWAGALHVSLLSLVVSGCFDPNAVSLDDGAETETDAGAGQPSGATEAGALTEPSSTATEASSTATEASGTTTESGNTATDASSTATDDEPGSSGDADESTDDGSAPPETGDPIDTCGDGVLDASEACDGTELGGATCVSKGLPSGELDCTDDCTFDVSGCYSRSARRRVFVTSNAFPVTLGGVPGGDAYCHDAATAAGLDGTYLAWLSDTTTTPLDRFTHADVPYQLLDGTVIANDWDDLVDGQIASAIDTDEFGQPVDPDTTIVATSTSADGTLQLFNGHCVNWTHGTATETMTIGNEENTVTWTDSGAVSCDTPASFYCFEQ